MHGFGRNHPLCGSGCGAYARPNVHFFDPDDGYLESPRSRKTRESRERWEARLARRCRARWSSQQLSPGAADAQGTTPPLLAIVELGCGTTVQTLRHRIDGLLAKCGPPHGSSQAVVAAAAASPAACVVRVNPSEDLLDYEETTERARDTIHLLMGAKEGIQAIDDARGELRRQRREQRRGNSSEGEGKLRSLPSERLAVDDTKDDAMFWPPAKRLKTREESEVTSNGGLIPLLSEGGQEILQQLPARALALHSRLWVHWRRQEKPTHCGVASVAILLSTKAGRCISEREVLSRAGSSSLSREVSERGLTLRELAEDVVARTQDLSLERFVYADAYAGTREMVADVVGALGRGAGVLVNYDMAALGQDGCGHISPISAVWTETAATDSNSRSWILVLDVWPATEPVWVPAEILMAAMQSTDLDSQRMRGLVFTKPIAKENSI